MIRTCLTAAALALLLTASGDQSDKPAGEGDQRKARGEVLGGSISDSMIPLDTIESRSPSLKIAPSPAASGAATEGDATEAGETTEPAEASEPAPAEGPAEN